MLYNRRDTAINDPDFPPILDWENRPKDLFTSYKLEKWNLQPGKAKALAAIWHITHDCWVFFYDKKDCIILDPSLPPCYDEQEIPEQLKTKEDWHTEEPNYTVSKDEVPKGCYRYYSPKREGWITEYLYSKEQLIWQPQDEYITKTILKKRYLLSEGWVKRLGKADKTTSHRKYKSNIYLYSRQRVEKFLADNAQEYAEWLDKRDRYLDIFEQNREKILEGLAKGAKIRQAQPIAKQFSWDTKKPIIKTQMVACLTCTYSQMTELGFLCTVHPYGLVVEQMPCVDWES